jgi:hypothetical protein
LIAVLLAAFIVYLYTPHLLFRAAVTSQYELVVRKGLPQVEEFFAAAIPSIFLNLQTFFLINLTTRLLNRNWFLIDRTVIAPLFDDKPSASKLIAGGDLRATLLYVLLLGVLSWWTGWRYGRLLVAIAYAGGSKDYFERFAGLRAVPAVVDALRYKFWQNFYSQYEQPLVPSVLRRDRVFIRTKDRLYHGRMFAIHKSPDGEISGIVITDTSKLALGADELIERGKSPIKRLHGPFFLRWSEITDIDYPQNIDVVARLRQMYAARLRLWRRERRQRHGRRNSLFARLRRVAH